MIDTGKYIMEQKPMNQPGPNLQQPAATNRPNEQSRLNIDDFLRILDPETKQVFVEKRS